MTVSRKSSATSTASTVTVPSGAGAPAAGDLMVLGDRSSGFQNPGTAVPDGWAAMANMTDGAQNTQQLLWRQSDGTEGGETITGLGGTGNDIRKILVIFTSDAGIDTITADTSPNSAMQNSQPSGQTIDSSTRDAPVIAVALYGASGAVDPRGFDPAADEEFTAATNFFLKHKIYNSSPADISVSMEDEGNMNGLFSGWFDITEDEGGATILTAETGSFVLDGQAAGLVVDGQIAAETGSFTLTGQDADFTLARHVDAGVGAFALSGQAADLIVTRHLDAESGSFALAGQDVDFGLGFLLPAETGNFTLTGQDASLEIHRALGALSGSFVLTGQDANFINPQFQQRTIIFYME